jgi:hypothetical protein
MRRHLFETEGWPMKSGTVSTYISRHLFGNALYASTKDIVLTQTASPGDGSGRRRRRQAAMESFRVAPEERLDHCRWATRMQLRYESSTGSSTPTTGAGDDAPESGPSL